MGNAHLSWGSQDAGKFVQLVSTHADNILLGSVVVESKVLALDSSDSCNYHECELQAHGNSMHEFMDEC